MVDTELIKLAIGAIGLLAGAVITSLFTRGDSRFAVKLEATGTMVDQLQKGLSAERLQRQLDIAQIHELLGVNRVQADYIGDLRRHIADGNPPPPPDYPPGLSA